MLYRSPEQHRTTLEQKNILFQRAIKSYTFNISLTITKSITKLKLYAHPHTFQTPDILKLNILYNVKNEKNHPFGGLHLNKILIFCFQSLFDFVQSLPPEINRLQHIKP